MSVRLVNEPLNIYIDNIEKVFNILVIESQSLLLKVVQDINSQIKNECGTFVFSINDKPFEIKDYLELIIDPLNLDVNNRKIVTSIQKLACKESIDEVHYQETNKIISLLEEYAHNIAFSFNGNITTKTEITNEAIIKMLNFQVDIFSNSFESNLFEYILNSNHYLKTKLFCFVNLFNFLETEQINYLIKSCKDNDIMILFIEASDTKYTNIDCVKTIIDSDFCQI